MPAKPKAKRAAGKMEGKTVAPKAPTAKAAALAHAPQEKKVLDSSNIFWADQLAAQIAERIKGAGKSEAVCKAGASPSGAKHIGNLFDVLKAYIVYKALKKKGIPSKFILTHDDRDPLRTIPAKLPNLEGILVDSAPFKERFIKYIGHPYHTIPDPFDCCQSWAEHFSKVWEEGILACGVGESEIEFVSNDYLYKAGRFDPFVETVLNNLGKVRKVFAPFQETMKPDYIPLNVICENCGKITAKVVAFDVANKTLTYSCEEKILAAKYAIKGCGHKGTVPWSQGKLVWRFEWPAQWGVFNVDFEAFGKDHAEGSWPSGRVIAKDVYSMEPPIPHIYEFLLVNGAKMSARVGNVYIAQDILGILEPEVFTYFYTKRSQKQRNLDLKNIHQLVDDFERTERIYWGADKANEHDKLNAMREYESAMPAIPKHMPIRIEYQFAAMISQLAPDTDTGIRMLRASGHIDKERHLTPEDVSAVAKRLNLAKRWVRNFAPEMAVKVNDNVPESVQAALTINQKTALHELAHILDEDLDQQKLYNSFYELSKKHGVPTQNFFRGAYQVLISKNAGPRLAPFMLALGRQRVQQLLENV